MVDNIRRVPLRTKELFLQHFQQSGHDGPSAPYTALQELARLCQAQLASTQNQVFNCSCMVAIPMQNKKEILNNER